jgi:threonine/homoserine/homoserine lactone efflux protein
MTPRARAFAFGSATGLVVAGGICALVIGGIVGELVALTLITLGLGAVVLLVFLEVGLSEDRERAEDDERRRKQAAKRQSAQRRPARPRWPRRPV